VGKPLKEIIVEPIRNPIRRPDEKPASPKREGEKEPVPARSRE
jgi:hypothetical protein